MRKGLFKVLKRQKEEHAKVMEELNLQERVTAEVDLKVRRLELEAGMFSRGPRRGM